MGNLEGAYIFPHPPILVPEIGEGRELEAKNTLDACKSAAAAIAEKKPATIIVVTPHGPVFQDYIFMSSELTLNGDFENFGAPDVKFSFGNNNDFVNRISKKARDEGIYAGGLEISLVKKYKIPQSLDHGTLVPLYFICKKHAQFKLVHISVAGYSNLELYRFGMCVGESIKESGEKVIFIASGDLSHKLTHDAPYGFSPRASEFDNKIKDNVENNNVRQIVEMDEGLCESAGECGHKSFIIMYGALDGYELKSRVLSYEGPFGVGYMVAEIIPGLKNRKRELYNILKESEKNKFHKIKENEDVHVKLARSALETYVKHGKSMALPGDLPHNITNNQAGTFVSIKKHGHLRGCIGTTRPTCGNIAEEIIQNAISAGTRDPRFAPVSEDELEGLVYSVDVLKESEPVDSIDKLDASRYGVIVRKGGRTGLLLPNLEGVDTPEQQISIALKKAGIHKDESYKIERFEVIRHK